MYKGFGKWYVAGVWRREGINNALIIITAIK